MHKTRNLLSEPRPDEFGDVVLFPMKAYDGDFIGLTTIHPTEKKPENFSPKRSHPSPHTSEEDLRTNGKAEKTDN